MARHVLVLPSLNPVASALLCGEDTGDKGVLSLQGVGLCPPSLCGPARHCPVPPHSCGSSRALPGSQPLSRGHERNIQTCHIYPIYSFKSIYSAARSALEHYGCRQSAVAATHRALCGVPPQGHGRPSSAVPICCQLGSVTAMSSEQLCWSAVLTRYTEPVKDPKMDSEQEGTACTSTAQLQPSMAAPTQPSSDHLPPQGLELF